MKDYLLKPKKKLGQNFLTNGKIIDDIITAGIENNDFVCLEIGPGTGAVTDKLLKLNINTVAIEYDSDLKKYLENKYQNNNNLHLIEGDILKVNLDEIFSQYFCQNKSISIISNLPYYITTPIIFHLMKINNSNVKNLVLMMQKEVGDRILAQPNSKLYNNFSVACQFYFDVTKVTNVKKTSFWPVPLVDSIVLKFKYNRKIKNINEIEFLLFIRAMFHMKRKTLLNNLSLFLNNRLIASKILNLIGWNNNIRAENLSLTNFYQLYEYILKEKNNENNGSW